MELTLNTEPMADIHVIRQPIYSRTLHVLAYELFYHHNSAEGVSEAEQVLSAIADMGLEHIVGGKQAYLVLSAPFLEGHLSIPLPADRVVIEVMDEVSPDVVQNLIRISRLGYTVAVGEQALVSNNTVLLELARVIKLDVRDKDELQLRSYVKALAKFDRLKVLANHVATQEQFLLCKELGFNLFQGDFFCKPKEVKRPRVPSNKLAMVQLLAELQKPHVAVSKLEELITRDVALSYKLLLYINSAFFGLPKQVESIQRGIVFLGVNAIKKWATLLLMARAGDKPNELLVTAVVRGKMCELLAEKVEYEALDTCFTVGLLSVLDALLDIPMASVTDSLFMAEDVNQALLEHVGTCGEILACVLNYEQGKWDEARYAGLDEKVMKDCYLHAVAWANQACQVLIGDF